MSITPLGVRISELSRRVGVAPETLRAWERRYGVLHPARTPSGYRVYGLDDELRARRMRQLIDGGWAAGEAAHAVTAQAAATGWRGAPPGRPRDEAADELLAALLRFDAAAANVAFDRVLAARTLDSTLRDVVLPLLREVGAGWERGEVSVGQEHFASELLTGRLRGLAREWGGGLGPSAVLACPSGERHDLGLLCCGLALHHRGWRITYLGADTPAVALEAAVEAVDPAQVVIGAVMQGPLHAAVRNGLGALAERVPVALGGAGAAGDVAAAIGATYVEDDAVAGAVALTGAIER
jgi:MerR family transcriptional regulator, light-induced transcriptional regulator